ncbi:MAG: ABC transporter permease subunit [bacterium]
MKSKILSGQGGYLLLILPCLIFYILFAYIPMYGAIIAVKDFRLGDTIGSAPWVGFRWFREFFTSMYFWRLIKNTLIINFYQLVFGFPVPIIFALVVNEIRIRKFKRTLQTISYMPHFISVVVVVGILTNLFGVNHGIVNTVLESWGREKIHFFLQPRWFRPLYVGSGIWQSFGYGSIIYIAAMSDVNMNLYEAAIIDGANRLQQIRHITLQAIKPTIVILLILNIGALMSEGFAKIILMYNPATYVVADVISTYVYRRGLVEMQYSFSAAVGLFNSVVNFLMLVGANALSKRFSEVSLW